MFARFVNLIESLGIEGAIRYAKKMGFEGVEFFFSIHSKTAIPDKKQTVIYKNILDKENIKAACVSCAAYIVRADAPDVIDENAVRLLCDAVKFAKAVGAPYLHHTVYLNMKRGLDFEKMLRAAIEGSSKVLEYARAEGITVLYEPQGFYFNGDGFIRFYEEIKKRYDNVGICADIGNGFWIDEEPYGLLQEYAKDIMHVHVKDYVLGERDAHGSTTLGGSYIREVPIGSGVVDLERFTKILRDVGYNGFVALEDNSEGEYEEKTHRAMRLLNELY